MGFVQSRPGFGNPYTDDRVLRSYLARVLPERMLAEVEPEFIAMAESAAGGLAAGAGLAAIVDERRHGPFSRVHQFVLVYLFTLSADPCGRPLAIREREGNGASIPDALRLWNSVTAVARMRRGLALSQGDTRRRVASGTPLPGKLPPLDRLAGVEAEFQGAFHLAFYVAELLGRAEAQRAGRQQQDLLRLLAPVAEHITARQCVAAMAEIAESVGGTGRAEDTRLAVLLRDAQVPPVRNGTTDVLAPGVMRVLRSATSLAAFRRELGFLLQGVREPDLVKISARVEQTAEALEGWIKGLAAENPLRHQADARRLALSLGRTMELALLARHAQWSLDHERDRSAAAAARRYAAQGINLLGDGDAGGTRRLARDQPA